MNIPSNIVGLSNQEKMRIINNWGYSLFHFINDDGSFTMVYSVEGKGLYVKFMDSNDVDRNINKAVDLVYSHIWAIMINW